VTKRDFFYQENKTFVTHLNSRI